MREIENTLAAWKMTLCESVDVGGLYSRNNIAHKWKAPFRSLDLRETVAWRTHDLLSQSLHLYDHEHMLGARILLRSAFETVAILIYLNNLTRKVLSGTLDFHEFSDKTVKLVLGTRDESTDQKAINIITILEKCELKYPGINKLYAGLSESAHPNYEGMHIGYSDIDTENFVSTYSNKWVSMYADNHINIMQVCIDTFYHEYNKEWSDAFEKLEAWIVENDEHLEVTKNGV